MMNLTGIAKVSLSNLTLSAKVRVKMSRNNKIKPQKKMKSNQRRKRNQLVRNQMILKKLRIQTPNNRATRI